MYTIQAGRGCHHSSHHGPQGGPWDEHPTSLMGHGWVQGLGARPDAGHWTPDLLWSHTWILPVPAQPLITWMTLDKLLNLFEPQFSLLQNKE